MESTYSSTRSCCIRLDQRHTAQDDQVVTLFLELGNGDGGVAFEEVRVLPGAGILEGG
jgi:hypothetical protein